ncbi:stage II sporulation protein M [Emticicia sp. CRIBPO]|uniref:stage II sporulation protein M n=1 Tax=Emticicia sp. CRIBPO TaxID=2683258 RepID=UPI001411F034|nr:stage II sporulation protein M [Emticicia sp. CRIBPO]NBA87594.1 stage II sporulation protein M [Emticicia sp. CRIBPO]
MKESAFIKQNSEKWRNFESIDSQNPENLIDSFIQLTDDLAYAKTFFPKSQTYAYLNSLISEYYRKIYATKKEKKGRFVTFWSYELPFLFFQYQRQLLYSFIFFVLAMIVGALSTANDDTFVRLILGDDYVNTTLENIQKGDPLAIYKSADSTSMFFSITINNIRVAFMAFVLGITFSFGTFWILFSNGIMLGAFQYFFFQKGFLLQSFLTIWIHGTLEISAIVIAGCAGFVMGNSLLFPGTYARSVSFRKGAADGLKITVGLVPIFIMAGFLESFVTRLKLHPAVSLLIIFSSLSLILWYFILLPNKLNKNNHE